MIHSNECNGSEPVLFLGSESFLSPLLDLLIGIINEELKGSMATLCLSSPRVRVYMD